MFSISTWDSLSPVSLYRSCMHRILLLNICSLNGILRISFPHIGICGMGIGLITLKLTYQF